jgi:hypothetical protein
MCVYVFVYVCRHWGHRDWHRRLKPKHENENKLKLKPKHEKIENKLKPGLLGILKDAKCEHKYEKPKI